MHILEISCPYNQMTEDQTGPISTLEKVRKAKEEKYRQLVDDASRTFGLTTKLHVVIVASSGVIPKKTITELRDLFGEVKAKSLAKEIVNTTLHESAKIYFRSQRSPFNSRHNSPASSEAPSSDDSIEEETHEQEALHEGLFREGAETP